MKLNFSGKRKASSPNKEALLFNFRKACQSARCPICELLRLEEQRRLEFLFYENINDPGLRKKFHRAGGLCSGHVEAFLKQGDALGLAILAEDLLGNWIAAVPESAGSGCPLCRDGLAAEKRIIKGLSRYEKVEEFWAAFRRSAGFCRHHLKRLMREISEEGFRRKIREVQRAILEGHRETLQEFIRKHDYRFREQGITSVEAAAVEMAWRLLRTRFNREKD